MFDKVRKDKGCIACVLVCWSVFFCLDREYGSCCLIGVHISCYVYVKEYGSCDALGSVTTREDAFSPSELFFLLKAGISLRL